MSSSLVRIDRIASSSSRAICSGHQAAPAASMPAMSVGCAPCGRLDGEGGGALGAVDLDRDVRVAQRVGVDRALQRRQRDALAVAPGGRSARPVAARAPAPWPRTTAGLAMSSTSRQSLAFWPRTPSVVVQKMSARSWRTWRLSVTRVRPPVPGSTPSSGTSGRLTALRAVVDQDDLVAGQRQLVAAAGAGAVDGGEELQPAVPGRVLEAVARLVGELAEVDLPGVAADAQHEDVGARAEHLLLGAGDDHGAHLGMLEADALMASLSSMSTPRS